MNQKETPDTPKKKSVPVIPSCLKIDLFGDLLKFSKKGMEAGSIFKKYDLFATTLAKETKEQRILLYQFLMALCLTAHARRLKSHDERKEIFDIKNALFLNVANGATYRSKINFRVLVNKRFKVVEYCEACQAKNTEQNLKKKDWKYCQNCVLDRNFYNVLSVFHKFADGSASFFLGNELIPKIVGNENFKRIPFGKLKEEVAYLKYRFSPSNLIAIDLVSAMAVSKKLLDLTKTQEIVKPSTFRPRPQGNQHPSGGPGKFGPKPYPRTPSPRGEPAPGYSGSPSFRAGEKKQGQKPFIARNSPPQNPSPISLAGAEPPKDEPKE